MRASAPAHGLAEPEPTLTKNEKDENVFFASTHRSPAISVQPVRQLSRKAAQLVGELLCNTRTVKRPAAPHQVQPTWPEKKDLPECKYQNMSA
jgi:hypothetical protein